MTLFTASRKLQLIWIVFLIVCAFVVSGKKAEAATVTVGSGCTISDAIDSMNLGTDSASCTATGAYGANDTVVIPAGVHTLTANVPDIASGADLTIQGANTASTIIDGANSYSVFTNDETANYRYDIKNLTIQNAGSRAIGLSDASEVNLENVNVVNSERGVEIDAAEISVVGCNIRDNTDLSSSASSGMRLNLIVIPANSTPSLSIINTKITGNTGDWGGGLFIGQAGVDSPISSAINLDQLEVLDNHGEMRAGMTIGADAGNAPVELSITATTIAGNTITTQDNLSNANVGTNARVAGLLLSASNLEPGIHLSNTTVANNSVTNNTDNQASVAGFFSVMIGSNVELSQINTTVVNNTVVHPGIDGAIGPFPAFALLNVDIDSLTIIPGGSAQNSLIMGNTTNGQPMSCRDDFPGAFFGISGSGDLTPINNGNNITDDTTCTGYDYQSGLQGTVGDLEYNGGNVQTMALLPSSPAIGRGGVVLGISTDARGITRPASNPDPGAYQSVLGDATANPSNGTQGGSGSLSDTGGSTLLVSVVAALVLVTSSFAATKHLKR